VSHAFGPGAEGERLTFRWFHSIPTAGNAERPPDLEYLAQVAKAAGQLGFEAVLTPTGTW
jgi:alkanesulfonate monooxygenase